MKLRKGAICPIHRSQYCCGREKDKEKEFARGWATGPGVTRIPDAHHLRGYRERRSPAAMRRLLDLKIQMQNGKCSICHKPMNDYREIVPDHIEPRGLGGSRRDDHADNIGAAHSTCNVEKGSKRI